MIGATGNFPDGKVDPSDEGELIFRISIQNGLVQFDFGKPVAWLSMAPADARQVASRLVELANECDTGRVAHGVPRDGGHRGRRRVRAAR